MRSRLTSIALPIIGILVTIVLTVTAAVAETDSSQTEVPMLQPQLDSMKARFMKRAPQETVDLYEGAIDELAASGILDTAINVGDTAPEFALPSATGDTVKLSQLLSNGPVVIAWYRGGWCPYCNMTLRNWMQALPVLKAQGAQLVAISPEIPDSSLSTQQKHDLEFAVLSDVGNRVAREYGIVYKVPDPVVESYNNFFSLSAFNGDKRNELPLAATYIVDTNGIVRYAFLDADYKKRAEPSEVIAKLKELQAE